MNRWSKWALWGVGGVVAVAAAGLSYVMIKYPDVGEARELSVEATPELIERGKYLATHVTVCIDCHSTRDWSFFAGPMVPESEGGGGERFTEDAGFPGTFHSGNITPAGIGNWSDGALARAITSGVHPDGRPMYTVMPFDLYRHLCDRDLHAIIAYLRTLKPIAKTPEQSSPNLLDSVNVRTLPGPPDPWPCPETSRPVNRGKYLATVGGCIGCHTPAKGGRLIAGKGFIGGVEFPVPSGGTVRSTNLTPHQETGIGDWRRDAFIDRFREYTEPEASRKLVQPGEINTVMPWLMYAGMTDEDLGAIYDYLHTLPPVDNLVARFSGPSAAR